MEKYLLEYLTVLSKVLAKYSVLPIPTLGKDL